MMKKILMHLMMRDLEMMVLAEMMVPAEVLVEMMALVEVLAEMMIQVEAVPVETDLAVVQVIAVLEVVLEAVLVEVDLAVVLEEALAVVPAVDLEDQTAVEAVMEVVLKMERTQVTHLMV